MAAEISKQLEKPQYKFALRTDVKDDKRFLPSRAHDTDSGWDVRACMPDKQPLVIEPFQYIKIPLGFKVFCPQGWYYRLVPRSSTFAKKYLNCLYGVVDETYENEVVLAMQYIPNTSIFPIVHGKLTYKPDDGVAAMFDETALRKLTINFADPIGQIIPVKRQEMDIIDISNEEYKELCDARGGSRKTGGFGSSDQKR
jgi:dUTPase